MDRQSHWDHIYSTRPAEELSWFQKHPVLSIELIAGTCVGRAAAVIDVGGGDSLLVDELLGLGYQDLTVLDVSPAALEQARRRLGKEAASVLWIASDVIRFEPERQYDLWHDRAVFHFLTDGGDRRSYAEVMAQALRPGGHALIATFALDGPRKCSGLDVRRYSAATLARELGRSFRLVESREQMHRTPGGTGQAFVYGRFVKSG